MDYSRTLYDDYEQVPPVEETSGREDFKDNSFATELHTRKEVESTTVYHSVGPHLDDGVNITGWPNEARPLGRRWNRTSLTADLLAVLCALAFVALGVAVLRKDGSIVDANSFETLQNLVRVATTLFPLVFAAICGRLTRQLAHWRLEVGSSIGTLDQLLGSHTVFNAILSQINRGCLNALGVVLIILWILSPLGTQGAQRMLLVGPRNSTAVAHLSYFDTDTNSHFTEWFATTPLSNTVRAAALAVLNSMYTATLLSSDDVKAGSTDLWNNIKIPILHRNQESDQSGWGYVSNDNTTIYASLIGLPLRGLPSGNTTFSVESSYIDLQCGNISTSSDTIAINDTLTSQVASSCTPGDEYIPCPIISNGTWQGNNLSSVASGGRGTWNLAIDSFVDQQWWDGDSPVSMANQTGIEANQARILFQSINEENIHAALTYTTAYCTVSQRYIESRISCSIGSDASSLTQQSPSCRVTAQRASQLSHASENITQFSFPKVWSYMSSYLPIATGLTSIGSGVLDMSVNYLNNTSLAFVTRPGGLAVLDDIPDDLFSVRLTQLLNSYLSLSQMYTDAAAGSETPMDANRTATVEVNNLVFVFVISRGWAAAYLVPALVLLVAAIVGGVLAHLTRSPEVLGFASTVLRDSKYAGLPAGAGTLDGKELGKILMDERIKFGIVDATAYGTEMLAVSWENRVKDVVKGQSYM